MPSIYRLRPATDRLIDELKEPYLWFSRPAEYKDSEDANLASFINNNENIRESFTRLFGNNDELINQSNLIGICCFTTVLPQVNIWKKFPQGHNGLFIAYDKDIIKTYFQSKFGLGDCFKKIEYLTDPTLFKKYSSHDILWEATEDGNLYKSLKEIEHDDKLRDELFLKIFTRLNKNYSFQNELRIILGGSNIPNKSDYIKGYKISIPQESILGIYTQPDTPRSIIEKIEKLNIEIHTLNKNN
ncbi:hypothetical protein [Pedobacter alpinus]|uniref:DUF2971 domain-containing protein n=1 Tax=Pedobacter alpinus TaxID=1590643 RepID=A0ABW5TS76_9SPHI